MHFKKEEEGKTGGTKHTDEKRKVEREEIRMRGKG